MVGRAYDARMLNVVREWKRRGVGWRAAAFIIFLNFALWLLDAAATLVFEHAVMKPDWLDAALYYIGAASSDRFTLGALAAAAIVFCAPYICYGWNYMKGREKAGGCNGDEASSSQLELDRSRDEETNEGCAQKIQNLPNLSRFEPRGLYIGNIEIDHRLVDERRVLTIMVSGFNASGCSVDIREARGAIAAKVKKLVYTPSATTFEDELDFGDMLSPSISQWISNLTDIRNCSEFFLKIIQSVPANMLDEIQKTDLERRIALDFRKLDVMVYPAGSGDSTACRLPLWGGATFHLSSAEWVKVHKVVDVTTRAAGSGF